MIEFVDVRGQLRPADWPKDGQPQTLWKASANDIFANSEKSWIRVGQTNEFQPNAGSPILYGITQLAIFNNVQRNEWYATQNMCPHKQAFVLSQGIIGDSAGTPKVACPLHKKSFNLHNGQEIGMASSDDEGNNGLLQILTFPIKLINDEVFVELPSVVELDAILGTNGLRVEKSDCIDIASDAIKVPVRNGSNNSLRTKETVLRAATTNSTSIE